MNKVLLIYNPRCSKSREAQTLLDQLGIEYEVIDYLRGELTEALLSSLPRRLGISFNELVRAKESVYKDLNLSEKKLSEGEWIRTILDNPVLLERPIIISDDKSFIARPPEIIKTLL